MAIHLRFRIRPLPFPAAWLALAVLLAAPARADLVVKEPYLLYPSDPARMELHWQLSATDTTRVEWGPDTSCSAGSEVTSETDTTHRHRFTFEGLAPAARTFYRVVCQGTPRRGSFIAAPEATAPTLRFFAYGDTRSYPARHDTLAGRMLAALAADPALRTFAVLVGDIVASGTLESSWTSDLFNPGSRNLRALMASVPLASCVGNHELAGGGAAGTLFPKYLPYAYAGGRYYSFDYGPAHVTVVDQYTPYTAGSPQYQWIANDLAAARRPWKFVVLHEPGWSAGGGHGNNTVVQTVLQPLFEQHGVAIVFGGHNHYYARAAVGGVQHLTIGGGGAPLHTPILTYPNVVTAAAVHHYSTVSLDGSRLHFEAVAMDGATVVDSFTLVREPVAVPPPAAGAARRLGLSRPRPDPSQGSVRLAFTLPAAGHVRLELRDVTGRRLWTRAADLDAGAHAWDWDGTTAGGDRAAPGRYFVRLETPWGVRTERFSRLR